VERSKQEKNMAAPATEKSKFFRLFGHSAQTLNSANGKLFMSLFNVTSYNSDDNAHFKINME